MSYQVLRRTPDGKERVIEEWSNARSAHRAALILLAHEVKNDRGDIFIVTPHDHAFGPDITDFDLPQWALDVLLGDEGIEIP